MSLNIPGELYMLTGGNFWGGGGQIFILSYVRKYMSYSIKRLLYQNFQQINWQFLLIDVTFFRVQKQINLPTKENLLVDKSR